MNEHDFQIKFQRWQNEFLLNKKYYSKQVWEDMIEHPLDILRVKLAELYQETDESQRLAMKTFLKENPNGLGNWSCSYAESQNY